MSEKAGIERALEIRTELFDIANSYAGKEHGHAAGILHEACNCILRADRAIKGTYDAEPEVMGRYFARMKAAYK